MAKISLKQKLEAMATLVLSFIGISYQKDRDGHMIAILQLAEPIPLVRGSQEVEVDGKNYPITATDVKEVKVHENDFDDDLVWDDVTDTGSYRGSTLFLDVAKNGNVWMKSTSFAQGSRDFRTAARNDRLKAALGIKGAPATDKNTVKTNDLKPVDTNQPAKSGK